MSLGNRGAYEGALSTCRTGRSIHFLAAAILLSLALIQSGCVGLTGADSSSQLTFSPAKVTFGDVVTGTKKSQTITLTNGGTVAATLPQATIAGSSYSFSGLALPATVDPGEILTFTVSFAPTSTGPSSGTIVISSDDPADQPQALALSGMGLSTSGPTITSQPASQSVTIGQSATFSVAATGTDPLSYQWKKNNSDINGATSASYTTPSASSSDSGAQFTVTVTDSVGSVTSDPATLTVSAAPLAPTITSQPANRSVTAGQSATFSVTVSGTSPLSYQWRKNGAVITGATGSSYTTPVTTGADNGAQFSVIVLNGVGSVTSSLATLTVNTPVTITSQPSGVAVVAGQTATFAVTATGSFSIGYQWRRNGVNIAGATAATYTTPATVTGDNGAQFTVVLTSSAGSVTSSIATLTVTAAPVATSITSQPASRTVIAGQTATFAVTAAGTSPLSYQWRKNGAAIGGATGASYTTPATAGTDNGAQFTVVVTNSVNTVTSSAATLTVNTSVSITSQPGNQSLIAGQTATFTVTATGTAPISYQWRKNGSAIGGATAASYTTPATVTGDDGSKFSVVVSNTVGSVTSSSATLNVTAAPVAPSITSQPVNRSVTAGQAATFTVTATGTAPMSYQWRKNGAAIGGATAASYTTPVTVTGDDGSQFSVAVSNTVGSVTSNSATLSVTAAPVAPSITSQPANHSVTTGQTATFTVTATGTAPMSYQWRKNGSAISSATAASYTTPATVTSDDGALFTVVVSNSVSSVTSNSATLSVTTAPVAPSISSQPVNRSVATGQTATFTVTATGTAPMGYQWRKNGSAISGATTASYTTPATVSSDDGAQFSVVVTNSIGNATSGAATLTVIDPPAITSQPAGVSVLIGQTANFSVTATGDGTLSYQWKKSGANISGATSATYTTPATVAGDNAAQFTVVVTNSVGIATSNAATLTVSSTPSITTQPVNRTVIAGQTSSFSVAATGTAPLSYQWKKNGATISGATAAGYTTPAAVTADNGALFTVVVSNSVGSATSNAATLTVNAATLLLTASPSSLAFGSVNVGVTKMLPVTITNSGNSNVSVNNVTLSGPGFTASGVSSGLTLIPGQTATLSVTFNPAGAGVAAGSVSVSSNATNSPAGITLSGTGVQPVQHSVTLSWTASTSSGVQYFAYRGTTSGGPYTKLNSSPSSSASYTDSSVQSGTTYFYVVTAVDSSGVESTNSNQVQASVPSP